VYNDANSDSRRDGKGDNQMSVKSAIRKALSGVYGDGEATAMNIFKGAAYDGQNVHTGWHATHFGGNTIYLGKSESEALETIEQIKESREENW
jgi:hypothetical protein